MKVLKFGGSSVAKPERIRQIIDILKTYQEQEEHFTMVCSAFGGVTDALIAMANKAADADESYLNLFEEFCERHIQAAKDLLKTDTEKAVLKGLKENNKTLKNLLHGIFLVREASPRTMDYVLSFGERTSNYIIANALTLHGLPADYLDARNIIVTDKNFGAATVDLELTYEKIKAYYDNVDNIQVVTGFVAADKGGLTTTLGRGGSDYTAALLAAGLEAEAIEIWTDVDGVLTTDPRKVKKAFTIPTMTYGEAMEMSHFGAKVIYPPTIQPAFTKNIPIYIKNTFNPSFGGTYISNKKDEDGPAVKGISSIGDISLLTLSGSGMFGVPGTAGRLFNALAKAKINIILITQGSSEYSISFAVQPKDAKKAKKAVEKEFEYEMRSNLVIPIKVENDLSVVAIIGENMRYQPGISGRLFRSLGKNGINAIAIAQGSSELNISVVINKSDEAKALNALHASFFLSDTKEIHLFMIGVGLIGSTLIKQIKEQAAYLKEKQSVEIKIIGMSNSKKMLFNEEGIDLNNWKKSLAASAEKTSFAGFIKKMKTLNLSNTIFIDNTANKEIDKYYEDILNNSISISTPNKIATSSSFAQYQMLKQTAEKRGVQFAYETNVGAGLPVISTLNDLINSGDRIIKIEGVLSGSLSFIFNSFVEGTKFSEIVKAAKEKGYTEPDPREDLSGLDVRRKLIILSRETGLAMEPEHVNIQNILPQACNDAATVAELMVEIEKADDYFESMRRAAADKGQVLRMIAKLENGQASIVLEGVGPEHPFYGLSGSDNMIVFTTERYRERPLVVTGPGAGAEVTAAGVFAEIIKIGNYLK
ncbi:MAG: bifunctional aspartate kinase/homoserine dehydrogenase I [Bacteroidota bacterium]